MRLIKEFKESGNIEKYFSKLLDYVSAQLNARKSHVFIFHEESRSFIDFYGKSPDNPSYFILTDSGWRFLMNRDYLIKSDLDNSEENFNKMITFLSELEFPVIIPCGIGGSKIGVIIFELNDYSVFKEMSDDQLTLHLSNLILTFQNVVLHNDTERKILNLTSLYEISKNVPQILTTGDSFKSLVKLTGELLKTNFVGLYIRPEDGSDLYLQDYTGQCSKDFLKPIDPDSIVGMVLESGEPVLTHHYEFKSFLAIPVSTASKVLGVLVAGTHTSYAYNDDDVMTLKILSSQFATINLLTSTVKQMKTLRDYILDSLTSGIVTVDTDGRIEDYNKTAAGIFPILTLKVIKMDFRKVFEVYPEMVKFYDESKGFQDDREISLHSEDRDTHLLLNIFPLKDNKNVLIGKTVFFKDITDMKELKQKLFRAEKLSFLGELAAGIAHEIRNPLTGIRMVIQLLGDELGEENNEFEHVKIVLDEVDRLEKLVNDMLAFGSPREPRFENIDLEMFIRELNSLEQSEFSKNEIKFSHNINNNLHIVADRMQLKQISLNLLKNSIQAIAARRVYDPSFEAEIQIKASFFTDDQAIIDFIDNGAGINKADLEKVFNPFYTSKDKGTGLGLSITQRLVEDNNGRIFVSSTENLGTNFSIVLQMNKENHV